MLRHGHGAGDGPDEDEGRSLRGRMKVHVLPRGMWDLTRYLCRNLEVHHSARLAEVMPVFY